MEALVIAPRQNTPRRSEGLAASCRRTGQGSPRLLLAGATLHATVRLATSVRDYPCAEINSSRCVRGKSHGHEIRTWSAQAIAPFLARAIPTRAHSTLWIRPCGLCRYRVSSGETCAQCMTSGRSERGPGYCLGGVWQHVSRWQRCDLRSSDGIGCEAASNCRAACARRANLLRR